MRRRYGVIGNPARHSLSPWLHGYFAQATQRPISYAAYQTPDFTATANEFFAGGGRGLNVTVPYKAAALAYADSATRFARQCGSANVLMRQPDNTIRAFNTDGAGLICDLRDLCGALEGKKVLLLGAGGAARAAAFAIAGANPGALWIYNRTGERAAALAEAVGGCARAVAAPDATESSADIILHATSAGHNNNDNNDNTAPQYPAQIFNNAALAYDLSYGAAAQPFLKQASAAQQTADGLGMLVWQGALSFCLWENVLPNARGALRALRRHLHRR